MVKQACWLCGLLVSSLWCSLVLFLFGTVEVLASVGELSGSGWGEGLTVQIREYIRATAVAVALGGF